MSPTLRKAIPWIASALFIAMYFSFMLGAALAPGTFTRPLVDGGVVSIGLLAGAGFTLLTLALVAAYIVYLGRRDGGDA